MHYHVAIIHHSLVVFRAYIYNHTHNLTNTGLLKLKEAVPSVSSIHCFDSFDLLLGVRVRGSHSSSEALPLPNHINFNQSCLHIFQNGPILAAAGLAFVVELFPLSPVLETV